MIVVLVMRCPTMKMGQAIVSHVPRLPPPQRA